MSEIFQLVAVDNTDSLFEARPFASLKDAQDYAEKQEPEKTFKWTPMVNKENTVDTWISSEAAKNAPVFEWTITKFDLDVPYCIY